MLAIHALHKAYGKTSALNGVSFEAQSGKVTAILAKNGAGKSTLMSIIAGLLHADRGDIYIDKLCRADQKQRKAIQARIGLAAQDTGLYPSLTVFDNLDFFARLHGLKRHIRTKQIRKVCEQFSLTHLRSRPCSQLSGGEKRRVHTAIALLHSPKLLLLDEPTLGADTYARHEILHAVKDIAAQGTAVLYTSHYLHEIEELNANVVIMEKGRVLHQASQQALQTKFGDNTLYIHFDEALAKHATTCITNSTAVNAYCLCVDDNQSISKIMTELADYHSNILQIERRQTNLEQLFHRLTHDSATC